MSTIFGQRLEPEWVLFLGKNWNQNKFCFWSEAGTRMHTIMAEAGTRMHTFFAETGTRLGAIFMQKLKPE